MKTVLFLLICVPLIGCGGSGSDEQPQRTPNTPALKDLDSDGVVDSTDNCQNTKNSNQKDFDNDGIGDACDEITLLTLAPPDKENDNVFNFGEPTFSPMGTSFAFSYGEDLNSFIANIYIYDIEEESYQLISTNVDGKKSEYYNGRPKFAEGGRYLFYETLDPRFGTQNGETLKLLRYDTVNRSTQVIKEFDYDNDIFYSTSYVPSKDGTLLFYNEINGGNNQYHIVENINTGEELVRISQNGPNSFSYVFEFTDDDRSLLIRSQDNIAGKFDIATQEFTFYWHDINEIDWRTNNFVFNVDSSDNGQFLSYSAAKGLNYKTSRIYMFDTLTNEYFVMSKYEDFNRQLQHLQMSGNGEKIVFSGRVNPGPGLAIKDTEVAYLWNFRDDELIALDPRQENGVGSYDWAAISNDGKYVVFRTDEGIKLRLFEE